MPDRLGRSLSQWDCEELARKLVADKVVESISSETVRRILEYHRLKPQLHGRAGPDVGDAVREEDDPVDSAAFEELPHLFGALAHARKERGASARLEASYRRADGLRVGELRRRDHDADGVVVLDDASDVARAKAVDREDRSLAGPGDLFTLHRARGIYDEGDVDGRPIRLAQEPEAREAHLEVCGALLACLQHGVTEDCLQPDLLSAEIGRAHV